MKRIVVVGCIYFGRDDEGIRKMERGRSVVRMEAVRYWALNSEFQPRNFSV